MSSGNWLDIGMFLILHQKLINLLINGFFSYSQQPLHCKDGNWIMFSVLSKKTSKAKENSTVYYNNAYFPESDQIDHKKHCFLSESENCNKNDQINKYSEI